MSIPLFELPSPDPDPALLPVPEGSLVDTALGPFGLATAIFDPTRVYRFRLSRVWDPELPRVNFLMLNPSTADAFVLDPTVRRCVAFAKAWGAGTLEVTNSFALRSTDPAGLKTVADPVGPGNDEAILAAAKAADIVVVAWGVHAKERGLFVRHLLREHQIKVMTLRLTKQGAPAHPLYVPTNVVPEEYL
jgi:hypothetical protein